MNRENAFVLSQAILADLCDEVFLTARGDSSVPFIFRFLKLTTWIS
jgi:hypothetical protein